MAALQDIERLRQLHTAGFCWDEVTENALHKVVARLVARDEEDLSSVNAAIDRFVARFGMSSEDFQRRYDAGELGDEMDHFEWRVYLDMRERIIMRLAILRDEAGHA